MTNDFNEQEEVTKPKRTRRTQPEGEQPTKRVRWVQIRLIPIWLRIIIILALFFAAAVAGLMFGYGFLGGGAAKDALKWDTWQHILDIISGAE